MPRTTRGDTAAHIAAYRASLPSDGLAPDTLASLIGILAVVAMLGALVVQQCAMRTPQPATRRAPIVAPPHMAGTSGRPSWA